MLCHCYVIALHKVDVKLCYVTIYNICAVMSLLSYCTLLNICGELYTLNTYYVVYVVEKDLKHIITLLNYSPLNKPVSIKAVSSLMH